MPHSRKPTLSSTDRDALDRLVPDLPEAVRERVRPLTGQPVRADGEFVLYWMRSACRGHENPALDCALLMAERLGVPAFVYHALSERYPYASDRHHTFILEGARDVQAELAARGIGYAFHLERAGQDGPHLRELALRAALVVTEDMPVEPLRGWTGRLAGASATPVWCVDTACVVPMRLVGRAHDRAFAFRRATAELRRARLAWPWQDAAPPHPPFLPADLPFEPVDLAAASIPDLVAACRIDHAVGPVPHTRGGSTAGYARWANFREHRLAQYAWRRNDALLTDAVSRMSPYLHHGQVSPLRIAREAAAQGGQGAAKFLDELLTWRELSYAWCLHRPDHDQLSALPEWALSSLRAHATDPRPALLSWETLARGRTPDELWNAAQRSLLIHGELHNNLRMTWGKALVGWTDGPERCLDTLIDLNHRYALDGRDPNSYGGLLWCLGLFDRPFKPERPIFGMVRPRKTRDHVRRLDLAGYRRATSRPARPNPPRVAVIGAGMAGLVCGRTLADHGFPVTVFDKGRAPAGRMSTRRAEGLRFDHGAQYFTARDERFARHVRSWVQDGVVARWQGRVVRLTDGRAEPLDDGEERFVGTPSMSMVAKHLAADLDVRCGTRIEAMRRAGSAWTLVTDDGAALGPYEVVIVAVPAPQAVPLLAGSPELAAQAATAVIEPCWAVMVSFDRPLDLPFDAARSREGPLTWIVRDGSKPGRAGGETWVMHAGPEWSARHLEDDREQVVQALCDAFHALLGTEALPLSHVAAHRWRHALASRPLNQDCLFDPDLGLGACGDWCLGARVEAAFLSGAAMAGRVLSNERIVGPRAAEEREGTAQLALL